MDLGEALDHVRRFNTNIVKPFQNLAEVIQAAGDAAGQLAEDRKTLFKMAGLIEEKASVKHSGKVETSPVQMVIFEVPADEGPAE